MGTTLALVLAFFAFALLAADAYNSFSNSKKLFSKILALGSAKSKAVAETVPPMENIKYAGSSQETEDLSTAKSVVARLWAQNKARPTADFVDAFKQQDEYRAKPGLLTPDLVRAATTHYNSLVQKHASELQQLKSVVKRIHDSQENVVHNLASLHTQLLIQEEYNAISELSDEWQSVAMAYYSALQTEHLEAVTLIKGVIVRIHGQHKHLTANELKDKLKAQDEYKDNLLLTPRLLRAASDLYETCESRFNTAVVIVKRLASSLHAETKGLVPDNVAPQLKALPEFAKSGIYLAPDLAVEAQKHYKELDDKYVRDVQAVTGVTTLIQSSHKQLSPSDFESVLKQQPQYRDTNLLTPELIMAAVSAYQGLEAKDARLLEALRAAVGQIFALDENLVAADLVQQLKARPELQDQLTRVELDAAEAMYTAMQNTRQSTLLLKRVVGEIQQTARHLQKSELISRILARAEYQGQAALSSELSDTAEREYNDLEAVEAKAKGDLIAIVNRVRPQNKFMADADFIRLLKSQSEYQTWLSTYPNVLPSPLVERAVRDSLEIEIQSLFDEVATIQATHKQKSANDLQTLIQTIPQYSTTQLTPEQLAAAKTFYDLKEEEEALGADAETQLQAISASSINPPVFRLKKPIRFVVLRNLKLSQLEAEFHVMQSSLSYYFVPDVIIVHFGFEDLPEYAANVALYKAVNHVVIKYKATKNAPSVTNLRYTKHIACHAQEQTRVPVTAVYVRLSAIGSLFRKASDDDDYYGITTKSPNFQLDVFDISPNVNMSLAGIVPQTDPIPLIRSVFAKNKPHQQMSSELAVDAASPIAVHHLSLDAYILLDKNYKITSDPVKLPEMSTFVMENA